MHHLALLLTALLFFFPAQAAPHLDGPRAEVESTLASISKAVLAGDQKAYLSHIDRADTHFYTEHIHWSDELKTYKPVEFNLAIADGPSTFTATTAEFPLTMSWRFENGLKNNWGMNAKGRTVQFPTVRFTKKDNHWLYQGEKWKEIYAPDNTFLVRFLEGDEAVAEDVVKAFPPAKAHVDAEFQNPVKERQTLVLYKSMDHLKATVYLNMPDSYLGGWSEPGESVKFMNNYSRGVHSWTAAYAHEYGHVASWELGIGSRKSPWWVQEGVAELCAGNFRPGYAARLDTEYRRKAAQGKLTDWDKVSDYLTADQSVKQIAYTQGNHLMNFVTANWKREGRNAWLRSMAKGKSLDEATHEALNMSFADLDKQWREFLAKSDDDKPVGHAAKDQPAEEPKGLRAELEPVLKGMAEATLQADQAGYLSWISRTDSVFAKEQENWAKDLARKKPESVVFEIEEDSLKLDASGAAVGTLITKWRMPGGKDREVEYSAKFVKGDKGWLYAGENWNVFKGEKSLVMYEDESLKEVAKAVADVLPEVRAHVDEGFGHKDKPEITERIQQVKLYTSMKHLQHSIYLSYTDGLSGWNEPGEAIKILAGRGSRQSMLRVLLGHEYGHVATFDLGPKANDMPWWTLEGIAELSAAKFARNSSRVDRMVKTWAKTDKIIDWPKLADFHGEAANHTMSVYNQGHHMIAYIADTFTRPKLNAWMAAQANGAKLDQATHDVLGMSFDDLDKKWRESLKEERPAEKPADKPKDEPADKPADSAK